MQHIRNTIGVLATGGTIAGTAGSAAEEADYWAGTVAVDQLVTTLPAPPPALLVLEQVAQIDSKDADGAFWLHLAARCRHWLDQSEITGLVIPHGTDTLEETAYFLSRVLPTTKPVVLTCAMRLASAHAPDGPRNLLDAIHLATDPHATGVLAVCAGDVHSAFNVQKVHTSRLNAFASGDAGPLAQFSDRRLIWQRNCPSALIQQPLFALEKIASAVQLPRVEIVMNHAGATGLVVRALVQTGVHGLVAAGTGNGTLSRALEAALIDAQAAGVRVMRASRCALGDVRPSAGDPFEPSLGLSAVKARIALMLDLLG
ncbi:MAG: asparaginase [Burkholderiaceae bacterium]